LTEPCLGVLCVCGVRGGLCRMFMELWRRMIVPESEHALLAPFRKLPRARLPRDKASGTVEVRHADT
jgi:hypothetical protein